jgi:lipid-A-disaccharide synthase-like uncharacterized protein
LSLHHWATPDHIWLAIGFAGQGLFASRFVIQWFKSEREGRSVIPVAFWYCSLAGGLVTLAYTIYLKSIPLSLGQASGLVVYSRNLYLIFRERSLLRETSTQAATGSRA